MNRRSIVGACPAEPIPWASYVARRDARALRAGRRRSLPIVRSLDRDQLQSRVVTRTCDSCRARQCICSIRAPRDSRDRAQQWVAANTCRVPLSRGAGAGRPRPPRRGTPRVPGRRSRSTAMHPTQVLAWWSSAAQLPAERHDAERPGVVPVASVAFARRHGRDSPSGKLARVQPVGGTLDPHPDMYGARTPESCREVGHSRTRTLARPRLGAGPGDCAAPPRKACGCRRLPGSISAIRAPVGRVSTSVLICTLSWSSESPVARHLRSVSRCKRRRPGRIGAGEDRRIALRGPGREVDATHEPGADDADPQAFAHLIAPPMRPRMNWRENRM